MVSLAVETNTGNVFGVSFKNLPFCRCSYVVDTDWTVVSANSQSLSVKVERHHWEDLYHVR